MKKYTLGLTIILVGIIVLLANLNVEGVRSLVAAWWPVLLIVAAGFIYWSDRRNIGWPLILSLVGLMLLMNNVLDMRIDIGTLIIPAILLAVGLSVMFGGRKRQNVTTGKKEDVVAILGGVDKVNASDDLETIGATSILGGINLDLRRAKVKKEATINVSVIMGGIELTVPEDVVVKPRTTVLLGGIEDKSRPAEKKNAPVLYIDGLVVMGGIEVKR